MTEKEREEAIEKQRKLIAKVKEACDMLYFTIHDRNAEGSKEHLYYENKRKQAQQEYEDFTNELDRKINR